MLDFPEDKFTDEDFERISQEIESDGCTGVPDWYKECCIVHDYFYRTHKDFDGRDITREEADYRFKRMIQKRSALGRFSPIAQWRYLAVRRCGQHHWDKESRGSQVANQVADTVAEESAP